ncbi:hypothetical protein ABFX02_08G099300 [Erythranthe guttata]
MWLDRTKRKHLLAALDKIKEELMVFGLLSLLMGHWIVFVAKICVKSSSMSSRFYRCRPPIEYVKHKSFDEQRVVLRSEHLNFSTGHCCWKTIIIIIVLRVINHLLHTRALNSFIDLFVLGITHVSYSFLAIALAMIKIYSWRTWENHAKTMALRGLLTGDTCAEDAGSDHARMRRLSSFVTHHTSHPWSQHKLLVWLLCFSRQFWSSIS